MTEKYYTIGVPMTALPRKSKSAKMSMMSDSTVPQIPGSASSQVRFHDCSNNANLTNFRDARDHVIRTASAHPSSLQICTLGKEDLSASKDSKFSSGIHVRE